MQEHKIVVIGASAGGVEALRELFRGLNPDLNAAIFVVLHIPANAESSLPEILSRHAHIPVSHAQDNQIIEAGHAYIAPPDHHLIIQDSTMRLTFGPRINHARPAIDPLFESAARNYGPDVIGVILSGLLYDGTKGLMSIKQAGGVAVVQDPEEALYSDMPASALQYIQVDYNLPVSKIAMLLNKLAEKPVLVKGETQVNQPIPDFSEDEVSIIREEMKAYEKGYEANQRSVLTCPDCGGVLWELQDGQLVRYRCHTGHIYNAPNLLSSYDSEFEKAFWMAIRVMVEKAAICNRLAVHAKENGNTERETYYLAMAKEAENESERVRTSWFNGKALSSKRESGGEQANDDITRSAE